MAKQDTSQQEHQVFGSDITMDKLGFVSDYVPEIAGRDALIISYKDLLGPNAEPVDSDNITPQQSNVIFDMARTKLEGILNEYVEKGMFTYPTMDDATEQVPLPSKEMLLTQMTHYVIHGHAVAYKNSDENHPNQMGIIVTPDLDNPMNITYFPDETFSNDISTTESVAYTMWHEAGHLKDPNFGTGKLTLGESFSDNTAAQTVPKAVADGHTEIGADLAERIYAQRLVGTFVAPGTDMDFENHMHGITHNFNQLGAPTEAFTHKQDIPKHITHIFQDSASLEDQASLRAEMVAGNTTLNVILAKQHMYNAANEQLETGKLSDETRAYMDFQSLGAIAANENPIARMADIGTYITGYNPIRAAGVTEALLEEGIVSPASPEGQYYKDVLDFFEERGDFLKSHPKFIDAKEQFLSDIQNFDISADYPENAMGFIRQEALDTTINDLRKDVNRYLTKVGGTANANGNQEAYETIGEIYFESEHSANHYEKYQNLTSEQATEILESLRVEIDAINEVLIDNPDIEEKYTPEKHKNNPATPTQHRLEIGEKFNEAEQRVQDLKGANESLAPATPKLEQSVPDLTR